MIISFKAPPDIAAHLATQENKSAYIRQLIRREMDLTMMERAIREAVGRRGDRKLERYFEGLLGGGGEEHG